MNKYCPICKSELKTNEGYFNISCKSGIDPNHSYSARILQGLTSELRFRIDKLCVSILEPENTTSIWVAKEFKQSGSVAFEHAVTINQVINFDFSDLDKLREKLQTYLLFS